MKIMIIIRSFVNNGRDEIWQRSILSENSFSNGNRTASQQSWSKWILFVISIEMGS